MRAALAVSRAAGPDVFGELTAALAAILGCDAALIAVFTDARPRHDAHARVPARRARAGVLRLPARRARRARTSSGASSSASPPACTSRFPPGTLFAAKGIDGYAGFPLTGSAGQPLGLIVAMCRRPLTERAADRVDAEDLRRARRAPKSSAAAPTRRASTPRRATARSSRPARTAIFVHDWDTGASSTSVRPPSALRLHPRGVARRCASPCVSENVPPYTEREAVALIEQAKAQRGADPLRVARARTRTAPAVGRRARSSARPSRASRASSPSRATSPSARPPRSSCATARSATGCSSTPSRTRSCWSTSRRCASSTSIPRPKACGATRAPSC